MATPLDLFTSDPEWAVYASRNGLPHPLKPGTTPLVSVEAAKIDVVADRVALAVTEGEWARKHPLESVGYESRLSMVTVRDGAEISVKTS